LKFFLFLSTQREKQKNREREETNFKRKLGIAGREKIESSFKAEFFIQKRPP
jgi:hypothetical protein